MTTPTITGPDEPLSRITLPDIKTLLGSYKSTAETATIGRVTVNDIATRVGGIQINVDVTNIGINIDPNLAGASSHLGGLQTGSHIQVVQTKEVGKHIPTNYSEAKSALDQIRPTRSGSKRDAFTLQELKTIAVNLRIDHRGATTKAALAELIKTAVSDYFNGSQR